MKKKHRGGEDPIELSSKIDTLKLNISKFIDFLATKQKIESLLVKRRFIFYNELLEICGIISNNPNGQKIINDQISSLKSIDIIELSKVISNIGIANYLMGSSVSLTKLTTLNLPINIKFLINKYLKTNKNRPQKYDMSETLKFIDGRNSFMQKIVTIENNIDKEMKKIENMKTNNKSTSTDCEYKKNLLNNISELNTHIKDFDNELLQYQSENVNFYNYVITYLKISAAKMRLKIYELENQIFSCEGNK